MIRLDAPEQSGYVHVYTGNGKGKTTAALGLALRAAGAGWRVFFAQFAKGMATSEITALDRFRDLIEVRRFGGSAFVVDGPQPSDVAAAAAGLRACREALLSGEYRMVILDEGNLAPALELFPLESLLELIDARPAEVELIITGRMADPRVLERADLVTEMREVKHYYRQGVAARRGVEQ